MVYALSVISPIWLAPEGAGGVRALILQNTFTLLLLALVALLPWREPALRPVHRPLKPVA
jgi:hypothetical protein